MSISFENLMLLIIVVQGFAVWFFEWQVYKIHKDRSEERAKWRQAKQKQKLKKEQTETNTTEKTTDGP